MKFLPVHWTDATIAFKSVDLFNVIITQFKVKDIEVRGNAIFGNRFWNNDVATLDLIANQNLSRGFVVFLRNSKDLDEKILILNYNDQ